MGTEAQPNVYTCDLCDRKNTAWGLPNGWKILKFSTNWYDGFWRRQIYKPHVCHHCWDGSGENYLKAQHVFREWWKKYILRKPNQKDTP